MDRSKELRVAVIIIVATLLANIIQSWYQRKQQISMERIQFKSGLINKALESNNDTIFKRKVKLFIRLGLISDANEKVRHIIEDTSFHIYNKISSTEVVYQKHDTLFEKNIESFPASINIGVSLRITLVIFYRTFQSYIL